MQRMTICEAHAALEHDFNVGGILVERPSNARRRASTAWQLHRMGVRLSLRCGGFDTLDDDAREVYVDAVVRMGLGRFVDAGDAIAAHVRDRLAPAAIERHFPRLRAH